MITSRTLLYLAGATACPVLLSGIFTLLLRKTRFGSLNSPLRQVIIGVVFGIVSALSTVYGIPAGNDVILNVRDASPMCAGLLFGSPAGFIAGLIGAVHRWLWPGGDVSRLACSLATCIAGVAAGVMRRHLFDDRRAGILSCIGLGATMEVLHMFLLLATNLQDVALAFSYVECCTIPMAVCNGIALGLSSLVCSLPRRPEHLDLKSRRIGYDFGFWLLVCVVVAFLATCSFTFQVINRITMDDAELFRNVTLYLMGFMEILIYTALFILVYQLLKNKVVRNLQRVNKRLNAITEGDLDVVVNVRSFREFAELSDHVNATVAALKQSIREAGERIDRELEFARKIQCAALPSVFPPYPERKEFDLFATMNAAREVGGDFYDFYFVGDDRLAFLIADVSGKGIPAAMFMMTAKTTIKDLAESGRSVDEVMTITNAHLCENNEADMFVTAWMGILDLKTGLVRFANAGHNPPLICRRDGSFEYFRTRAGLVLAGMEGMRYRAGEVQLEPGDTIFLYTDGVTEATDGECRLYGEDRLRQILDVCKNEKVDSLCRCVKADVDAFVGAAPQFDDITMLALRYNKRCDK